MRTVPSPTASDALAVVQAFEHQEPRSLMSGNTRRKFPAEDSGSARDRREALRLRKGPRPAPRRHTGRCLWCVIDSRDLTGLEAFGVNFFVCAHRRARPECWGHSDFLRRILLQQIVPTAWRSSAACPDTVPPGVLVAQYPPQAQLTAVLSPGRRRGTCVQECVRTGLSPHSQAWRAPLKRCIRQGPGARI